ncbi:N-6 DNA methylase [Vibrio atlanticus]|uniref:site-specific DNA-methyltransferase (adenine-specific) n=1 Tax=Vibrio atlanticus TaxID=693153 RepID=A0A1C3IL78_9VIBR|nr:N-6 DNA Methylase [Vibrio atlanticus]
MISSTKEDGRIGVVVPHGVLFREGDEGKIRKGLLVGKDDFTGDLIEAVIGLPPALFFNTGISASVVIINKKKTAELKNKVIFIDASQECDDSDKMSRLREEDIHKITQEYSKAKQALIEAGEQTSESLPKLLESVAVDKYLRVVDIREIEENEFNLNLSRYIDNSEPEEIVDVFGSLERLAKLEGELKQVTEKLVTQISVLNIEATCNEQ